MGALAAFLGGAGGAGLTDMTRRWDRNDEISQQQAQRQKEMDDQREARQNELQEQRKFQSEQAQLERDARGSGGGSRSRRGGGESDDPAEMDALEKRAAVNALFREGVPHNVAQRLVDGAMTNQNPFTRTVQRSESYDDGDRQKNVTTTQEEPDVERYVAMVKKTGEAFANAASNAKSNASQMAEAEQKRFETGSGREAQTSTAQRAGELGRGVGVSKGVQQYDSGDDRFSPATGALTAAKIGAEKALAADRSQKAISEKDKREGSGSIKEEMAVLKTQAAAIDKELADVRSQENSTSFFSLSDQEKKRINGRRIKLEERYDALNNDIAELRQQLKGGGTTPPAARPTADAPTPAARAAIKALPPGSKQIGTSNGKPVYQTPDGKKFIGN